jgi:hypothetical protein
MVAIPGLRSREVLQPRPSSTTSKPLSAVANEDVALRDPSGLPDLVSLAGRSPVLDGTASHMAVSGGRRRGLDLGSREV